MYSQIAYFEFQCTSRKCVIWFCVACIFRLLTKFVMRVWLTQLSLTAVRIWKLNWFLTKMITPWPSWTLELVWPRLTLLTTWVLLLRVEQRHLWRHFRYNKKETTLLYCTISSNMPQMWKECDLQMRVPLFRLPSASSENLIVAGLVFISSMSSVICWWEKNDM